MQRTLLANYHVSDPQTFYSGSDFWRVPDDPTTGRRRPRPQPPYYVTLQMPGQAEPSFSLTSTYVPTGDRNNLAAFVAVERRPRAGLRHVPGAAAAAVAADQRPVAGAEPAASPTTPSPSRSTSSSAAPR